MKVSKARGWFKNPSLRFSYLYHLVLEQLGADIFLLPANYPNKNTSKVIDVQTESNNGSVKTRLVSLIVCPSVLALAGGIH